MIRELPVYIVQHLLLNGKIHKLEEERPDSNQFQIHEKLPSENPPRAHTLFLVFLRQIQDLSFSVLSAGVFNVMA